MKIKVSAVEYSTAGVSLLCHSITLVLGLSIIPSLQVPQRWVVQFAVLTGASFSMSVMLIIARNVGAVLLADLLRFVLILLASYPFGNHWSIRFTLLIPFILEAIMYLPLPYGLVLAGSFSLAAVMIPGRYAPWGAAQAVHSREETLPFLMYTALLMGAAAVLKVKMISADKQRLLINRLNRDIHHLTDANLGFQQYASMLEEHSRENERKRISREIHDTIGYTLVNVIALTEAAKDMAGVDPDRLPELLDQVRLQAREGLNESRRFLDRLQSIEAQVPRGINLIAKIVKNFQRATNVQVEVEYGNAPNTFGDPIDQVVYRMVQEGLTNAFRHGRASRVRIYFWLADSGVTIYLWDNGCGAPEVEIKEGMGLKGMRERIQQLGGRLQAANVVDGFELSAWIPLERATKKNGKDPDSSG